MVRIDSSNQRDVGLTTRARRDAGIAGLPAGQKPARAAEWNEVSPSAPTI